jgi:predicted ester cyclase
MTGGGPVSEQNKALYRRFVEEGFRKKNPRAAEKAIEQYISPNCVDHAAPPGTPTGIEGAKQTIGAFLAAFPDVEITLDDLIAEGDKVVARFTARGTHKGAMMGMAPTGKRVTVTAIDIVRISQGKIVEHWESMDQLGMMQQLGVIPPPGQGAR